MSSGSVQRLNLLSDGLRLAAELYLPAGSGPHPGLILCHGIPAKRVPDPNDRGYPLLAEKFSSEGFAVLIFNFRGSGESEGNLDLFAWTRDLNTSMDYLYWRSEVIKSRISVMGFSGGAAVSLYCAAHDNRFASVVICACPYRFFNISEFSSAEQFLRQCREVGTVRDADFPSSIEDWISGFEKISPLDHVDKIAPRPFLIIHGDQDETVPPVHAQMLYEKAREPKDLAIIKGGDHRLRINQTAMHTALYWLKKINKLSEGNG